MSKTKSVRIPLAQYAKIKAMAIAEARTLTQVIARAIETYAKVKA